MNIFHKENNMEIRTLRYFLEIAREENMSKAAERLHVSQSTLSKQIKNLEAELGKKLFNRHSFNISLTNEGILLRKRAEDIVTMVDKTTAEFSSLDKDISGDIYIGCAETQAIIAIGKIFKELQSEYPLIKFHLKTGNTEDTIGDLDKGLLDFAFIIEPADATKYHYLPYPNDDYWGVIMPKTHPLANKKSIAVDDIKNEPLIVSRQGIKVEYPTWFLETLDTINIVATFNLPYNAGKMVEAGLGILLAFDGLINTSNESNLCFRPLNPKLKSEENIIWRKYQVFTPAAELLLQKFKEKFG